MEPLFKKLKMIIAFHAAAAPKIITVVIKDSADVLKQELLRG